MFSKSMGSFALLVAMQPAFVGATTVDAFNSGLTSLPGDSSYSETYDLPVGSSWVINDALFTLNGLQAGFDYSAVSVSIAGVTSYDWTVTTVRGLSYGLLSLTDTFIDVTVPFTVSFNNTSSNTDPLTFTYAFTASALPTVPLPAAGLLLPAAFGALVMLRRRNKKITY